MAMMREENCSYLETIFIVAILCFLPSSTAAITFRLMQPFDQADEGRANSATGVQVVDVPVEISLDPVTAALQNDITVTVSIVGGTAQGIIAVPF